MMFQSTGVKFLSHVRERRHFSESQFFSMGRICVGWIRRSEIKEPGRRQNSRTCTRIQTEEYLIIATLLFKSLQCLSKFLDITYLTFNVLLSTTSLTTHHFPNIMYTHTLMNHLKIPEHQVPPPLHMLCSLFEVPFTSQPVRRTNDSPFESQLRCHRFGEIFSDPLQIFIVCAIKTCEGFLLYLSECIANI